MFDDDILKPAEDLLAALRNRGLKIATAESCTGGLVSGALTAVAGSSDVFDRGFVTYSNEAKSEMLGVPVELVARLGAVSAEVAEAMARGALEHARCANVSVSVTGVAGPGGGSAVKPVGLVYIAAGIRREGLEASVLTEECKFGDIGRGAIRRATVLAAFALVARVVHAG